MSETFSKKAASDALQQISDFIAEHPVAIAGILGAGGLGAAGGAYFTSSEPGETPSQRANRRIKNAIIGGLLGAGSATAARLGYGLIAGDDSSDAAKQTAKQTAQKATEEASNKVLGVIPRGSAQGAVAGGVTGSLVGGAIHRKFGADGPARVEVDAMNRLTKINRSAGTKGPLSVLGRTASPDEARVAIDDFIEGGSRANKEVANLFEQGAGNWSTKEKRVLRAAKALKDNQRALQDLAIVAPTKKFDQLVPWKGNAKFKSKLLLKRLLHASRRAAGKGGGLVGGAAAGASLGATLLPGLIDIGNSND